MSPMISVVIRQVHISTPIPKTFHNCTVFLGSPVYGSTYFDGTGDALNPEIDELLERVH